MPAPAFRFVQFELPWELGPADGRYVVRSSSDGAAEHVLILATLGAPERRLLKRRRGREAEPEPVPVATTRATVVDAAPVSTAEASAWTASADIAVASAAWRVVARAVRAHRIAAADPAVHAPGLGQALVVRAGWGLGEEVAHGRWREARELPAAAPPRRRGRRVTALRPQERVAAVLGGRSTVLVCEELVLRARGDLEAGLLREAALGLRVAVSAAVVELGRSRGSEAVERRIEEVRERSGTVEALADAALADALPPDAPETIAEVLGRLEAALRARALSESSG